jgi:hypothetical protein
MARNQGAWETSTEPIVGGGRGGEGLAALFKISDYIDIHVIYVFMYEQ